MASQVRVASEADLPRVVELLSQLSIDDPREQPGSPLPASYIEAFRRMQADDEQRLMVSETDGRIVGSLVLLIIPNLTHQGRPYATVENVVVDESERGSGRGRELMEYAIDEAKRAGCYKIALTSHKSRTDAHRFYEHLGFVSTHEAYRIEFSE
jgi:GNAT superfamily N-acetyltransferase